MEDCLNPSLNLTEEDGYKEEKESGFFSKGKIEEDEEAKGGGGGLMKNLISTMVTPLSFKKGEGTEEYENGNGSPKDEAKTGESGAENGGGEGGLINNLISNFFHRSEGEGVAENGDKEDEKTEVDEANEEMKTENGSNGGRRGIIDNIVSHFPPSIPDDAVPTADEATILINSLVRD